MNDDPFSFPGEQPDPPSPPPLMAPNEALARQMTINMAMAYQRLYPSGSVGILALGVVHDATRVGGSGGIPTFHYQPLSAGMRPAVAIAMGAALMRTSRDAFKDMADVAGLPLMEFMDYVNTVVNAGDAAAGPPPSKPE